MSEDINNNNQEEFQQSISNDIVRLDLLFKFLFKRWLTIVIFAVIGLLLGLFFALTQKNKYTSTIKFLPEAEEGGFSSMKGLGSFLGNVNNLGLGGQFENILHNELLYADLVHSSSMHKKLLKHQVVNLYGDTMTVNEFLGGTGDLVGKVDKDLVSVQDHPMFYSKSLKYYRQLLASLIVVELNDETGTVSINTTTEDPYISYQINQFVYASLKNELEQYMSRKLEQRLKTLKKERLVRERNYEELVQKEASFIRSNQRMIDELSIMKLEDIRLEKEQIRTLLLELDSEVEYVKMELESKKPYFEVLDGPFIPNSKSNIRKLYILIIAFIGGMGLAFTFLLLQHYTKKYIVVKS